MSEKNALRPFGRNTAYPVVAIRLAGRITVIHFKV